jgi:hypothetical protein
MMKKSTSLISLSPPLSTYTVWVFLTGHPPGNVMLGTQSRSLFLIDIPDFSPSGDEPKNHSYSPEYIDNCTSFERDNYAVMKMSCELLGLSWGQESDIYPTIANAIRAELEDLGFWV